MDRHRERRNGDLDPRRSRSQIIAQEEWTTSTGFVIRRLRRRFLREESDREERGQISSVGEDIDIFAIPMRESFFCPIPHRSPGSSATRIFFNDVRAVVCPLLENELPIRQFLFLPPSSPYHRGSSWSFRPSPLRTVFNQRLFVASTKSITANKVYREVHFFPHGVSLNYTPTCPLLNSQNVICMFLLKSLFQYFYLMRL